MEQSKIGKVIHAEASKVIHTAKVERHQQSPISMHGRLISRRRKNLSDIREHFKGSHQFFRISIQMPIESYMPKIAKEYLFGLKLESRYSDVGYLLLSFRATGDQRKVTKTHPTLTRISSCIASFAVTLPVPRYSTTYRITATAPRCRISMTMTVVLFTRHHSLRGVFDHHRTCTIFHYTWMD